MLIRGRRARLAHCEVAKSFTRFLPGLQLGHLSAVPSQEVRLKAQKHWRCRGCCGRLAVQDAWMVAIAPRSRRVHTSEGL